MYDRYFEESSEYTTDEVLERAYALGVASVCGDPDEDAYDRLKRRSPDTYDETIVELAYEEGRAGALDLKSEETDSEAIWEQLVETEVEKKGDDSERTAGGAPDALRAPEGTSPVDGLPDSLDLPSFLRRE